MEENFFALLSSTIWQFLGLFWTLKEAAFSMLDWASKAGPQRENRQVVGRFMSKYPPFSLCHQYCDLRKQQSQGQGPWLWSPHQLCGTHLECFRKKTAWVHENPPIVNSWVSLVWHVTCGGFGLAWELLSTDLQKWTFCYSDFVGPVLLLEVAWCLMMEWRAVLCL